MRVAFNLIGKYDEVVVGLMFNPRVAVIDDNTEQVEKVELSNLKSMITIGLLVFRIDILF